MRGWTIPFLWCHWVLIHRIKKTSTHSHWKRNTKIRKEVEKEPNIDYLLYEILCAKFFHVISLSFKSLLLIKLRMGVYQWFAQSHTVVKEWKCVWDRLVCLSNHKSLFFPITWQYLYVRWFCFVFSFFFGHVVPHMYTKNVKSYKNQIDRILEYRLHFRTIFVCSLCTYLNIYHLSVFSKNLDG